MSLCPPITIRARPGWLRLRPPRNLPQSVRRAGRHAASARPSARRLGPRFHRSSSGPARPARNGPRRDRGRRGGACACGATGGRRPGMGTGTGGPAGRRAALTPAGPARGRARPRRCRGGPGTRCLRKGGRGAGPTVRRRAGSGPSGPHDGIRSARNGTWAVPVPGPYRYLASECETFYHDL